MKNIIYCIAFALFSCSSEKIEIPFSYERNIYIRSMINDTIGGSFMFDSGAYGLYLDSLYNTRPGLGFGAHTSNPHNIGEVKFTIHPVATTFELFEIINTKSSFGKQCDGIVGWDLFKDYVLKIDYKNQILSLTKPEDFEIDTSYTKIPLIFRNNMFYVNLQVDVSDNLNVSGEFVLDLGFGGSVYFTGETVRKYQIDTTQNRKAVFGLNWGLREATKSVGFVLRGKKIKIQDFELVEPTIECSYDSVGVLAQGDYLGLLGNRALERFDVMIDFPNKELYLKPNQDYKKRMKFRSFGIGFVDRTDICAGLIVNVIYSDSDADKAGVKSGDIITHLDGKAVKANSEKMIKDLYENKREVLITFARKDSVYQLNLKVKEEI